ncbi:MAG: hypothetical protein LBP34_03230 [Flavobacteriaceae bacterium]|jgi:hypothetical protein|nr:hypothetical protein [Flavobacteriaceae bacterium]
MRKILVIAFTVLFYIQSFAYTTLQVIVEENSTFLPPPPPEEGAGFTPFIDPGESYYTRVPIDFITPFLLISAMFLAFYIVKKNKVKTI